MKKMKLLLLLLFLMSILSISFAQEPVEGDLDQDEPDDCETGGLANTGCPYWNVKVTYEATLVGPGATVTCETGGQFKCKE